MIFTAVIPVRGGSKRIKDKNIQSFGDSNLLVHKIHQLKKVSNLTSIVVATDSDVMASMALAEEVDVYRIPVAYTEGEKSFGEMVAHVAEHMPGDHIVWCQATSPLVTPEIYQNAIETYEKNLGEYDSLASVEVMQKHIWDDNGPVNYERGSKHPRSQDLPKWYFVTGVFIAPKEKMIEWSHNIGPNPYKYPLGKIYCVDIDDEIDLDIARALHDRVCDCNKKIYGRG